MNLSFSNLDKPSNKLFKKIADFLLYTLPLYLGAILALPIDEKLKLWINAIATILVVTIKGISKFSAEDEA